MNLQRVKRRSKWKHAGLRFVSDSGAGMTRKKSGRGFVYYLGRKRIRNGKTLDRIRKLVIPPAWKKVWICPDPNGHLQATGLDVANRKQYRYHSKWNDLRSDLKYFRLAEFGKALPALRKKLEQDMQSAGLTQERVIATVVSLMDKTFIRVGNSQYEKEYGSYGLTTLKDRHVTISGERLQLSFTGKKGVKHSISVRSRKLARIIKQCREIPGKELFQYIDGNGEARAIDSGMVNEYIRHATGGNFTTKDFRTWAGTLHALQAFKSIQEPLPAAKAIATVVDSVSRKLGNTPAVCRKYYIHPYLFSLFENDSLGKYPMKTSLAPGVQGLSVEENLLMRILKSEKGVNRRVA
jgi:DNA topoisomerase I